jgi:hypothetical protein
MRDSNFNSIRSIFNAANFVNATGAPEELCTSFRNQLKSEKALIEEYLKLNEPVESKEPDALSLHFEEVWKKLDLWLQDGEEEL